MKAENRLSATTTLTVNVVDSDDQDPTFEHDVYTSKVSTIFMLRWFLVKGSEIQFLCICTLQSTQIFVAVVIPSYSPIAN